MAYRWLLNPPGHDLDLLAVAAGGFDNQGLAEDWLSAFYAELSAAGVDEVTLIEENRLVYGPMPLAQ